jgi:hypothetical protein
MGAIARRKVRVRAEGHREGHEVAAVIPVDELQKARREPKWLEFRQKALAERRELRAQGRSS